MNKRQYYSDLITNDEIDTWENGKAIIMDGGTDTGKTTFITKALGRKSKKENKSILYLCNRLDLKKDVYKSILDNKVEEVIDVSSYQSLQSKLNNNREIVKYDYIVCDECHYIYDDSTFNDYTDLVYSYFDNLSETVLIYISATADHLFKDLKERGKVQKTYTIKKDYSYVDEVVFFNGKKEYATEQLLSELLNDTDDKIIFFSNNIEKGYKLYKKFKDNAIFYCSESNKTYAKYSDKNCIKEYKDNLITFDKRLLITTTVLDNGINIRDNEIKHIVTDVFDTNRMIQCLGRKRSNGENDKCKFYIYNYNNMQLGGYYSRFSKAIKEADMYLNDFEKFSEEHLVNNRRYKNDILYINKDGHLTFHEIKYKKIAYDLDIVKEMLDSSYSSVILNRLGTINLNYFNYKKKHSEDAVTKYLNENAGIKLDTKELRKELVDAIDLKDKAGRQASGIKSLNNYLQEKYNYKLESKSYKKTIDGKRKKITYWIISKI